MMHLLSILHDHIKGFPTQPFETDWAELLALSKKHEAAAIVYAQCRSFMPASVIAEFERAYSATLFYSLNRMRLIQKVETELEGIAHFTIKGASVAAFYPSPAFRTMGDTDIVIHTEDRQEADRRLKRLGMECFSCFEDREWQYRRNNMEFELHDHLVYSETVTVDRQAQYFNDFWRHVEENRLDWNFHFLFLIFHLRKHFMNSGVGFRQFMDIAVLCARGPAFDWAWIERELKTLGLWSFAERVLALNAQWFGVPSPLPVPALSPQFLEEAEELIGKNGVFGFDNADNRSNAAVNNALENGGTKAAMAKTAVGKLFPGYNELIKVPRYGYLKGRRILLPAVWLHRAARSIKNRRVGQNMKTVAAESFVDMDTLAQRKALYERWGLDR